METSSETTSLSSDTSRNRQWIVPERLELYLESQKDPRIHGASALRQLWQMQSILMLSHIFEVLDHMAIYVSDESTQVIQGTTYSKPCLVLTRSEATLASSSSPQTPSVEIETDISKIICEHFYKYYIFTHQVEKREERIARPVVSGDPHQTASDIIQWVVQPKNSNALVRKLRGKRKQALMIVPMVEHSLSKTNEQISETVETAERGDITKTIWIPSDVVILGRKLNLTPYHAAKTLSILDFVTAIHIKAYLELLEEKEKLASVAGSLANVLEWFDRIQSVGEWQRAASLETGYARLALLRQFAMRPNFNVAKHIPNGATPAAFKKLQEHIKGPRCDWVTNRTLNHHLVRTPYEDLLKKLDTAAIQVPDHTFKPENSLDLGIDETILPWTSLPTQLDPANGCLLPERAKRKRQQISNIIHYITRVLHDGCRVVDFCGGGGHISLVLAWLFPKIHVILIDRNDVSLALAERRKTELALTNMEIISADVQLWQPSVPFQVGVAIHACGSLSDIIMEKCIAQKASYVMAPCCFGALQNCDTSVIRLPRSQPFSQAGVTLEDYMSLASVADVNTSGVSVESTQYKTGKKAMGIIDHDRNLRASQDGYSTFQFTMRPPTCTPKNEIICGISPMAIEDESMGFSSKNPSALDFEATHPNLTIRVP